MEKIPAKFFSQLGQVGRYHLLAYVGGTILVLLLIAFVPQVFRKDEWRNLAELESTGLPVIGKGPEPDVSKCLDDGRRLFPNEPYILPVDRVPIVILPHKMINTIKSLPETQLSFDKEVYSRHLAHLALPSGAKVFSDPILNSIKQDLTRNISKTLDTLWEEVEYAFEKAIDVLPAGEEGWKTVHVYNKVLHIVALLSGRVFVGLPLSRDADWLKATISYPIILSVTVEMLWKRSWWQRPILAPIYLRTLGKTVKTATKCLKPLFDNVPRDVSPGKKLKTMERKDGQLIQWLISHTRPQPDGSINLHQLAHDQLTISLAAIHTTSITISHILYDLGSYPHHVDPLRKELEGAIAADRAKGGSGKLTKVDLTKLWKMDSFIKESQRTNPPILVQMRRLTTAPLTLPSGQVLPVGTCIGIDAQQINRSVPYYNADPTEHAQAPFTTFDGFRYAKLRSVPGNENRHQFVTSSTESLNFGHGTHACPGRFFASNEIKIAFAEILLHWDVRLKDGAGPELRPKNLFKDTNVMPNLQGEVEMRRRAV